MLSNKKHAIKITFLNCTLSSSDLLQASSSHLFQISHIKDELFQVFLR